MNGQKVELAKLGIDAIIAIILILAMTWIILSPVSDEVTKGALVVISSAVGFLFGKAT